MNYILKTAIVLLAGSIGGIATTNIIKAIDRPAPDQWEVVTRGDGEAMFMNVRTGDLVWCNVRYERGVYRVVCGPPTQIAQPHEADRVAQPIPPQPSTRPHVPRQGNTLSFDDLIPASPAPQSR